MACHTAQQQQLPEQEETQGTVCRREHQTKAWRVSQSGIFPMTYNCGDASAVKRAIFYCFRQSMLFYNAITDVVRKLRAGDWIISKINKSVHLTDFLFYDDL